ncbi:hypothetical protein BGX38DRAFT_1202776 [Terfezia claveryi]|nr:hypothetical protein BGX38DRAFT_1202776 [Terfezia claveryi]
MKILCLSVWPGSLVLRTHLTCTGKKQPFSWCRTPFKLACYQIDSAHNSNINIYKVVTFPIDIKIYVNYPILNTSGTGRSEIGIREVLHPCT